MDITLSIAGNTLNLIDYPKEYTHKFLKTMVLDSVANWASQGIDGYTLSEGFDDLLIVTETVMKHKFPKLLNKKKNHP